MVAFTSIGIGLFLIMIATMRLTDIANIFINGSILLYLFKPNVREYFGKLHRQKTYPTS